ncbi:glutamate-rich protein 5 [Antechinus flavipes]|uniref:glutamate-rich protein 5 n=1 Tax=Antechinus flavipes TaxID=38775 RepID=UPI00223628FE|nr:glutamate-rich protein 5 [Antechinus flavipes]
MGCSSSTQTQNQESSRPVNKTGVTNGLKQSATSDGNSSSPYENEICLDKTKQCTTEGKVDANDKTGPTNILLAGDPRVMMPFAADSASSTCEEGYPEKAGSPSSGERVQTEYLKSTDETKNPEASKESVPPISAGKNELPATDEKNDREIEKSTQPIGKIAELEIFGIVKEMKSLKTAREIEPPETEHSQHLEMSEEADLQRTMKEDKHLITSEETEPQEIVEDIQHINTDRRAEMLEKNNYVGTSGETETSGTLEEAEYEGTAGETKPSGTCKVTEHEEAGRKMEPLGTHTESEGIAGETKPSGMMEEIEHEETPGETKPSGMMEEIEHEETLGETKSSEMMEGTEHEGTPGETKPLGMMEGTEHEGTPGETKPLGMMEETEYEGITGETKPLGMMKETEHEGISGGIKPSGMMEKTEHEGTPGETKSLGMMEEIEHEGTPGETEPSGAMKKMTLVTGEKNNLQGIVEDNEFPEIVGEIQSLRAAGKNDHSRAVRGTELPERVEKILLVETVGGTQPPIIDEGPQENMKPVMEVAREINMNEENQAIEGETGERVETETHSEIVSKGSETKEEETGEAVDTTTFTEIE